MRYKYATIIQFTDDELKEELERRERKHHHEQVAGDLAIHILRNPESVKEITEDFSLGYERATYTIEVEK